MVWRKKGIQRVWAGRPEEVGVGLLIKQPWLEGPVALWSPESAAAVQPKSFSDATNSVPPKGRQGGNNPTTKDSGPWPAQSIQQSMPDISTLSHYPSHLTICIRLILERQLFQFLGKGEIRVICIKMQLNAFLLTVGGADLHSRDGVFLLTSLILLIKESTSLCQATSASCTERPRARTEFGPQENSHLVSYFGERWRASCSWDCQPHPPHHPYRKINLNISGVWLASLR